MLWLHLQTHWKHFYLFPNSLPLLPSKPTLFLTKRTSKATYLDILFLLFHRTIYVPCINQSNILKYNACHVLSYLKPSKKLSVLQKWKPISITLSVYRFIIQCCLLPLQFTHSFTVLQQYWTSTLSHMHVNHYLRPLDWFFLLLYS